MGHFTDCLGTIFLLSVCNVLPEPVLFDGCWILLLILPSFIGVLTAYKESWSRIGFLTGILLLLRCQVSFDQRKKLVLPAALILIGLRMTFRGVYSQHRQDAARRAYATGPGLPETCAIFKRLRQDYTGEVFTGVEFTAALGRVDCDLTGAKHNDGIVIRANGKCGKVP